MLMVERESLFWMQCTSERCKIRYTSKKFECVRSWAYLPLSCLRIWHVMFIWLLRMQKSPFALLSPMSQGIKCVSNTCNRFHTCSYSNTCFLIERSTTQTAAMNEEVKLAGNVTCTSINRKQHWNSFEREGVVLWEYKRALEVNA